MVERPALSRGELAVVRLLWEIGPAAVRTIHAAAPSRSRDGLRHGANLSQTARNQRLRQLATRGTYPHLFGAVPSRATVIRETVDDLVERLFGGETMPLVRHLIEERGIGESELAELRAPVERLEQPEPHDDQ